MFLSINILCGLLSYPIFSYAGPPIAGGRAIFPKSYLPATTMIDLPPLEDRVSRPGKKQNPYLSPRGRSVLRRATAA